MNNISHYNKNNPAQVYSDFDGTAVDLASRIDPRNWFKRYLPPKPGYAEFLYGVQSEGVEVAGVVTARPWFYNSSTRHSLRTLGLSNFFDEHVYHMGSNAEKWRFLLEKSRDKTIGMIEDKPHMLVQLLGTLLSVETTSNSSSTRHISHPIIIGIVPNKKLGERYIDELFQKAIALQGSHIRIRALDGYGKGFRIKTDSRDIRFIQMPAYSHQAGKAFAKELLHLSQSGAR